MSAPSALIFLFTSPKSSGLQVLVGVERTVILILQRLSSGWCRD